jgi:hypothetical protein
MSCFKSVSTRLLLTSNEDTTATMGHAVSKVARKLARTRKPGAKSNIPRLTVKDTIEKGMNLLDFLPTEVRLMVFEDLLVVYPKVVFRGAKRFGPLDKKEFDEEVPIPWQILQTCRKFHDEAAPILYGKNKLIFCTGSCGYPGWFLAIPISIHYLELVTDVGIYFRADDPRKPAAKKVAKFIEAITQRTQKLDKLVVLVSSDRFYEAMCPWDILWCDHPVSKQLVRLIESKKVNHLKLRFHDGAGVYQEFGRFLAQHFWETVGATEGRSLTFTKSCSCPPNPDWSAPVCFNCSWPAEYKDQKPIEEACHPLLIEANQERLMDLQEELLTFGLL